MQELMRKKQLGKKQQRTHMTLQLYEGGCGCGCTCSGCGSVPASDFMNVQGLVFTTPANKDLNNNLWG